MRLLVWALRAFLFFALFAFALNNEHLVTVHWFFGYQWRAPLVIVVLVVLTAGAALGVLAMVPSWWRHRSGARQALPAATPGSAAGEPAANPAPSGYGGEHPPRIGL